MASNQRVFKGGAVYVVTGPAKKKRSLVFMDSAKVDGRELLLFRPLRRIKKQQA